MYLVYAVIAERDYYEGDQIRPLGVFETRAEAIDYGVGYLFDDDAEDRYDRRVWSQDSVRMIEFDGVFPEADLCEREDGRAGGAHGECVWRAEA
jgi:hypothetical protein